MFPFQNHGYGYACTTDKTLRTTLQALSLVRQYCPPGQMSVSKILVGQVRVPVLLAGLFLPPVPVALLAVAALVLSTVPALAPALSVRPEAVAVPLFVLLAEPVRALGQFLAPATVPQLLPLSTCPSSSPPPYEPPLVPSARDWPLPLHVSRPRAYPPHR